MPTAIRRIWLCADDYGISPGVNDAIRQLIDKGRINATSVMTASPHLNDEEAAELDEANAAGNAAIGLHVTLTAPFLTMNEDASPQRDSKYLPQTDLMKMAMLRKLDEGQIRREIAAQVDAFIEIFDRPPAYLDGHQHVQLLPQVRNAFLQVAAEKAPGAWVRQCGRPFGARSLQDRKALVIDILNIGFRNRAARRGIATNPGFAGAYAFDDTADFARLFPRFLKGLPDGGLVMCHPGFVDAELQALDTLTTLREKEFAFLNSDEFPAALAAAGVELARPSGAARKAS